MSEWVTKKVVKKYNFNELKKKCPHIVDPRDLIEIEKKEYIDGIVKKFRSVEWIEYQEQGWKFSYVAKVTKVDQLPTISNFSVLPLHNGWGDVVVFERS